MYIDTHAHIYMEEFRDEYEDIVIRALAAKVNRILMPNIDLATMKDVLSLHNMYPDVCLPMVGLHPCSVTANYIDQLKSLEKYLPMEEIIAVGEIGMDLYWDVSLEKEQEEAFRMQIEWAKAHDYPIVIHSRSSIDKTISIIEQLQDGSLRGVFHCFGEGMAEAKRIMDVGFYMGIGGVSTFKKTVELRETIAAIPIKYLLLETDAPYLTPMPYRGKRNESSYIPYIAAVIAEAHNISIESVGKNTSDNAAALFGL